MGSIITALLASMTLASADAFSLKALASNILKKLNFASFRQLVKMIAGKIVAMKI